MLTEPAAFSVAVQALLSSQKQSISAQSVAGGEHLAFFGSGREAEDQYLHMVVAFFLQRHVQFVGLVQGGFQAVHQALVAAEIEANSSPSSAEPVGLVDHNPSVCLVCTGQRSATTTTGSSKNIEGTPQHSAGGNTPGSGSKIDFFGRMRSKSAVVKDKLFDYIVNPVAVSSTDSNQSSKTSAKSMYINFFLFMNNTFN